MNISIKDVMNPEKNNQILVSQGYKPIFGLNKDASFKVPVPVFSMAHGKVEKKFVTGFVYEQDHAFFIKGYGAFFSCCFASKEFAEVALKFMNSIQRKKVRFEGKEYFVINGHPGCVWLNKDNINVASCKIKDGVYVRADKLDVSQAV